MVLYLAMVLLADRPALGRALSLIPGVVSTPADRLSRLSTHPVER